MMKTIIFALAMFCSAIALAAATPPASDEEVLYKKSNTANNYPLYKSFEAACAANPPATSGGTVAYSFYRASPSGEYSASCIWQDNNTPPMTYSLGGAQMVYLKKCVAPEVRDMKTGSCIKPPEEEKKCKDDAGKKIYVTMFRGFGTLDSDTTNISVVKGFPKQNSTCKFAGTLADLTIEHCDSDVYQGQKRFTCTFSAKSTGEDADPNSMENIVSGPASDAKGTKMNPEPSPTGQCPQGSVGGMVDGVLNCFGEGKNPTQPTKTPETTKETKTTDADGNQVKTNVKTTTNSDGSETKQTTVTTTKPDGTVETKSFTETTKAPTGDNGKEDKPDTDFCKSNPSLTICKNSIAKAACGAVTCQGDAIQCELLQQQTAMRCSAEQEKKDLEASSLNALGKSVVAGNDPLASSLPSPSKATAIAVPNTLTTSGWLGGGQCFADKSFTLMGKVVSVPFSKACEALVVLRYALMVVASLVSFKILRGAFLSE